MNYNLIITQVISLVLFKHAQCSSFEDVTSKSFGPSAKGLVAAFGDFNGNKNTDIFVIADGGNLNSFCTRVILDCLIP